ncbi:MAG: ATP-grasp domain-containing protein [Bdellovibrio sp.]|nr:ATP-grasp domain-containing protein [Bdellovibrio sp.]
MEAKYFKKVCVANRGEIACRVIRACHKLGIQTLVLYSDHDRDSLAVKLSDEAVALGGMTALESYLNIEKVVSAAKKQGADALHPGYGFLSENSDLALACERAGICFIGPRAEAMDKMGMKNVARDIVNALGLPIVPGYNGDDQSLGRLEKEAKKIGYPILIKAAAGGGGKGMQVVESEKTLATAIEAAKRNAKNAFGDDTILIEKYFPVIKHIEIQVLADQSGHTVHLFERECSVQRRHQKIIEETPSPSVTPELREKMGQAAVAIARSVQYLGVGTVEFIVDSASKNFYFLEMNTRIQVEHPITEEVTGVDLVEWQLRIAQGEALTLQQSSLKQTGHAVECRLYAEDWRHDFLPMSGKVLRWREVHGPGIRIDHGLEDGSEIGIFYDPMLAKVIAHGNSRQESMRKMHWILARLELLGLTTNHALLSKILEHPQFIDGSYGTNFLPLYGEELKKANPAEMHHEIVYAVWLKDWFERKHKQKILKELPTGWRNNFYRPAQVEYECEGQKYLLSYRHIDDHFEVQINHGATHSITFLDYEDQNVSFKISERQLRFCVVNSWAHHPILGPIEITQIPRFKEAEIAGAANRYLSSMPGKIVKVFVRQGDKVKAGDELVIIESMKMENSVAAHKTGVVKDVFVASGQMVEKNEQLIQLEGEE